MPAISNPQPSTPSPRLCLARPAGRCLGRRAPHGFTLTELLVVIAIIAVLAAMGSWGVMQALGSAKQTRIKLEIDQLDAAFRTYKDKYGSYPPNLQGLAASAAVRAHIARAFPRYDLTQLNADLTVAGLDGKFRPDQALVFWLSGFSPDPQHPFVTPGPDPSHSAAPVRGAQIVNGMVPNPLQQVAVPLFDFDATRLAAVDSNPQIPIMFTNNGIAPSYFPQGTKPDQSGAPYVYYDADTYNSATAATPPPPVRYFNAFGAGTPFMAPTFPNAGPAIYYALDKDGDGVFNNQDTWANPDSFQIISAGPDAKYTQPQPNHIPPLGMEPARLFPTGTYYDPSGADDDNVSNFSAKARMGDAKP